MFDLKVSYLEASQQLCLYRFFVVVCQRMVYLLSRNETDPNPADVERPTWVAGGHVWQRRRWGTCVFATSVSADEAGGEGGEGEEGHGTHDPDEPALGGDGILKTC